MRRGARGQALLEYVLALAALFMIATVMTFVVTAAIASADRTNALVQSDSP